jgi:hypothetical protein
MRAVKLFWYDKAILSWLDMNCIWIYAYLKTNNAAQRMSSFFFFNCPILNLWIWIVLIIIYGVMGANVGLCTLIILHPDLAKRTICMCFQMFYASKLSRVYASINSSEGVVNHQIHSGIFFLVITLLGKKTNKTFKSIRNDSEMFILLLYTWSHPESLHVVIH